MELFENNHKSQNLIIEFQPSVFYPKRKGGKTLFNLFLFGKAKKAASMICYYLKGKPSITDKEHGPCQVSGTALEPNTVYWQIQLMKYQSHCLLPPPKSNIHCKIMGDIHREQLIKDCKISNLLCADIPACNRIWQLGFHVKPTHATDRYEIEL